MRTLHIKKGDRVVVLSGVDKGVVAEVISVDPANNRVTVQGVNLVKKHRRESQTATGRKIEGGIINVEAPIHASNVQVVVDVDGKKDVPTVPSTRRRAPCASPARRGRRSDDRHR